MRRIAAFPVFMWFGFRVKFTFSTGRTNKVIIQKVSHNIMLTWQRLSGQVTYVSVQHNQLKGGKGVRFPFCHVKSKPHPLKTSFSAFHSIHDSIYYWFILSLSLSGCLGGTRMKAYIKFCKEGQARAERNRENEMKPYIIPAKVSFHHVVHSANKQKIR